MKMPNTKKDLKYQNKINVFTKGADVIINLKQYNKKKENIGDSKDEK